MAKDVLDRIEGGAARQSAIGFKEAVQPADTRKEKTLTGAQDAIRTALESSSLDATSKNEIADNLKKFEAESTIRGVSRDSVGQVYKDLARILDSSTSKLSPDLRQRFVREWSEKLANPDVKQGWHDTCGPTLVGLVELYQNPEQITRAIADVMTGGKAAVFGTSGKRDRFISVDLNSLQPDNDSLGKNKSAFNRSYSDQVAQVVLGNIMWGTMPTLIGTQSYKQCSDVRRPSRENPAEDKSCESVEYKILGFKISENDGNGMGFGGASSPDDLNRIHYALTGKRENLVLNAATLNGREQSPINDETDLALRLTFMSTMNKLPKILFVDPKIGQMREDYLLTHPEKDDVTTNLMHYISVTGRNSDGSFDVLNPWGIKSKMSAAQLFQTLVRN